MSGAVDLRRGARGESVRDLQGRLAALGHVIDDDLACFGEATEGAVRAFQDTRGLVVDGVCGTETWTALVESSFTLGDRLLYLRRPMIRGDDVGELQHRLNRLGFDARREDGILGERTAHAVSELQRNTGLAVDGICGPATLATLGRVGSLASGSVATVREREQLRRGPRQLAGQRVYLVAAPGFEAVGAAAGRALSDVGAVNLLDTTGDDDAEIAAAANRFGADLLLALRSASTTVCGCAYFASRAFRSEAGHRVAGTLTDELATVLDALELPHGRTSRILRETRMAAVVCELAPRDDVAAMRRVVERSGDVGHAVARGVRRAVEEPPPDATPPKGTSGRA